MTETYLRITDKEFDKLYGGVMKVLGYDLKFIKQPDGMMKGRGMKPIPSKITDLFWDLYIEKIKERIGVNVDSRIFT